jgi:hypothetical protein
VRLEGLGELKKSNDLIGTRTCDLPASSIVPQPTWLPHFPQDKIFLNNNFVTENYFLPEFVVILHFCSSGFSTKVNL